MISDLFKNIRVYCVAVVVYIGVFLYGYTSNVWAAVTRSAALGTRIGAVPLLIDDNMVAALHGGVLFGAICSAPISAKLGRKWTIAIFSAFFCIGTIIQLAADRGASVLNMLYVGEGVKGIGAGAFLAVAPAYVSECSPKEVRGRIVGLYEVAMRLGHTVSTLTIYGMEVHQPLGPIVWRVTYGTLLAPTCIMILGLLFIPESPRFLLSKEKGENALVNLAYLRHSSIDDLAIQTEFFNIHIHNPPKTTNFVRIMLAVILTLLQTFDGRDFAASYAGLAMLARSESDWSLVDYHLVGYNVFNIIGLVSTVVFLFFAIERVGRRWLLFWSATWMSIPLFIMVVIRYVTAWNSILPSPPTAILLYLYCVARSCGWGPVPIVYISEIFPTQIRHYGIAAAVASQAIF
ncbi:hypothetical protein FRC03_011483, partial [Tulasnella sp. 419]